MQINERVQRVDALINGKMSNVVLHRHSSDTGRAGQSYLVAGKKFGGQRAQQASTKFGGKQVVYSRNDPKVIRSV